MVNQANRRGWPMARGGANGGGHTGLGPEGRGPWHSPPLLAGEAPDMGDLASVGRVVPGPDAPHLLIGPSTGPGRPKKKSHGRGSLIRGVNYDYIVKLNIDKMISWVIKIIRYNVMKGGIGLAFAKQWNANHRNLS